MLQQFVQLIMQLTCKPGVLSLGLKTEHHFMRFGRGANWSPSSAFLRHPLGKPAT